MSSTYQNFYIKAPVAILEVPLPLAEFAKLDDEGNEDGFYTIPEYLAAQNHTIERFSSDGYFAKGFAFNIVGLDEMRSKFADFGMTLGADVFILSPGEIHEELAKPEWSDETDDRVVKQ